MMEFPLACVTNVLSSLYRSLRGHVLCQFCAVVFVFSQLLLPELTADNQSQLS